VRPVRRLSTQCAPSSGAPRAHRFKLRGRRQEASQQRVQALPDVRQRRHGRAEPGRHARVAAGAAAPRYEGRQARRRRLLGTGAALWPLALYVCHVNGRRCLGPTLVRGLAAGCRASLVRITPEEQARAAVQLTAATL